MKKADLTAIKNLQPQIHLSFGCGDEGYVATMSPFELINLKNKTKLTYIHICIDHLDIPVKTINFEKNNVPLAMAVQD